MSAVIRSTHPWKDIYAPVFAALWQRRALLSAQRAQLQTHKNTRNYGKGFTWLPHKLTLLWRHGVPKIG